MRKLRKEADEIDEEEECRELEQTNAAKKGKSSKKADDDDEQPSPRCEARPEAAALLLDRRADPLVATKTGATALERLAIGIVTFAPEVPPLK